MFQSLLTVSSGGFLPHNHTYHLALYLVWNNNRKKNVCLIFQSLLTASFSGFFLSLTITHIIRHRTHCIWSETTTKKVCPMSLFTVSSGFFFFMITHIIRHCTHHKCVQYFNLCWQSVVSSGFFLSHNHTYQLALYTLYLVWNNKRKKEVCPVFQSLLTVFSGGFLSHDHANHSALYTSETTTERKKEVCVQCFSFCWQSGVFSFLYSCTSFVTVHTAFGLKQQWQE